MALTGSSLRLYLHGGGLAELVACVVDENELVARVKPFTISDDDAYHYPRAHTPSPSLFSPPADTVRCVTVRVAVCVAVRVVVCGVVCLVVLLYNAQEPKGANVSKGKHPSVVFGDWEAQTKVSSRRIKYARVQRLPYGTRPPVTAPPYFASLTRSPGRLGPAVVVQAHTGSRCCRPRSQVQPCTAHGTRRAHAN